MPSSWVPQHTKLFINYTRILLSEKKENTLNVGNRNELSFKLQPKTHLKLRNMRLVTALEGGLDFLKRWDMTGNEEMDKRMFKAL